MKATTERRGKPDPPYALPHYLHETFQNYFSTSSLISNLQKRAAARQQNSCREYNYNAFHNTHHLLLFLSVLGTQVFHGLVGDRIFPQHEKGEYHQDRADDKGHQRQFIERVGTLGFRAGNIADAFENVAGLGVT